MHCSLSETEKTIFIEKFLELSFETIYLCVWCVLSCVTVYLSYPNPDHADTDNICGGRKLDVEPVLVLTAVDGGIKDGSGKEVVWELH